MIKRLFAILALYSLPLCARAATTQTALAADSFTRANAANLGVNWANFANNGNGQVLCNIVSNSAQVSSASGNCQAIYSANDFPNDQYAQMTMTNHTSAAVIATPCVDVVPNIPAGTAVSNGVTSSLNGYCAWTDGTHYRICKTTTGQTCQTPLATSASAVPTAGDIELLTVQQVSGGRQLTFYVNGIQILQTTDASNTYVTGWPGIEMVVDGTTTDVSATNFIAGAVSTPPTITNASIGTIIINPGPTILGTLTGTGQAVQFQTRSSGFNYLGRLQIIANGQISNPTWVMECSQDGGNTWFQMPVITVPSLSPQLQDVPSGVSLIYDISGLGGAQFRFGLSPSNAATVVTGTINITAMTG